LPAQSVAVQVRFTEYSLEHAVFVVSSTNVGIITPLQASEAVACVKLGVAGQKIVDRAGSGAITGGVLSSTVMVCMAVRMLPAQSVAVQVRVLEYSLGHAVGVVTSAKVGIIAPSQASSAVGFENTGVAGQ
jgi:hypothetical protein